MINFLNGAPRIDRKQTLRFLGCGNSSDNVTDALIAECENLIMPSLAPAAVYDSFDISLGDTLDLGFAKVASYDLKRNLDGCKKIVLFAATVGVGTDRLIAKYKRISPARAAVLQALGSSAVECWCDDVNAIITQKFGDTAPRFSCGYGDLPLSLQKDIFAALNVQKHLGITLSDDFFMTPTKSVTAIIGVKNGY